ncbi:hypothetical protein [Pedobacter punctiformis]|uniref:Lipoprotein n=1 Tax=Pedobacter punctiformis TaxID=3004097 RepID=A0ABT4LCJ6_9SPHI|nr:hypothetical protein [Pedobacter sp. HCMS5-2]MCZ4245634.1 hypothetical protein [Pedobacter sp. HCMS5-2]
MKNILPIIAVTTVLMTSCQSNTTKNNKLTDSTTTKSDDAANASECFLYAKNRDTATLKLNTTDTLISGDLSYNLFQKDKNTGKIEGIVKGDTLIADYTFQSEGMQSVRQIVWLKQSGKLVEGFGDVEEADGKVKFKNISKLKFGKAIEFSKTDCK